MPNVDGFEAALAIRALEAAACGISAEHDVALTRPGKQRRLAAMQHTGMAVTKCMQMSSLLLQVVCDMCLQAHHLYTTL